MGAVDAEHTVVDSPVGPLTLVRNPEGLCGLYMHLQRHLPDGARFGPRTDTGFEDVTSQLTEYFAGERTEFTVPLAPRGTEFQQRVWAALRTIPYGETWSYLQLAEHLGNVAAIRAVAAANGRNPIGIIVPCHRVVGSNGALTGYAGGLGRKQFLLDLESPAAVGIQDGLF
ncbi:methylated-DNA--[protein]-cysteine S-methyltransferase [Prescottella equi]|nr:methylated-DNA--[protein]-cysteine S-methyltransferase [Prescottella equi]MBU4614298.1 methylated-DNA--[protein]-cysteine S-methyltransferase [Rhodococcus sp. GG48]MDP8017489.1 methylated-DNA--[protein]-cysteine S-methyltransferase [Prescottella equi]WJJ14242.1 methylated-DNA--[protein]-cysteine S-methyltransferase [Prescottella equi]